MSSPQEEMRPASRDRQGAVNTRTPNGAADHATGVRVADGGTRPTQGPETDAGASPIRSLTVAARWGVLAILLVFPASFVSGQTSATAPAAPEYKQALAPRAWSFPRDHGRHDGYKTEWWYFTGNLKAADGHRLGYQLTFFRTAMRPDAVARTSPWAMKDLYFAHAAVSDIDSGTFRFKDRLERGRPGLGEASDQTMDVHIVDWTAQLDAGAAGRVHLPRRSRTSRSTSPAPRAAAPCSRARAG